MFVFTLILHTITLTSAQAQAPSSAPASSKSGASALTAQSAEISRQVAKDKCEKLRADIDKKREQIAHVIEDKSAGSYNSTCAALNEEIAQYNQDGGLCSLQFPRKTYACETRKKQYCDYYRSQITALEKGPGLPETQGDFMIRRAKYPSCSSTKWIAICDKRQYYVDWRNSLTCADGNDYAGSCTNPSYQAAVMAPYASDSDAHKTACWNMP